MDEQATSRPQARVRTLKTSSLRIHAAYFEGPFFNPQELHRILALRPVDRQIKDLLQAAGKKSIQTGGQYSSKRLQVARGATLKHFLREMGELQLHVRDLSKITVSRILQVAEVWLEQGVAPATVRTRVSHMNWLLRCLGESELVNATAVCEAWWAFSQNSRQPPETPNAPEVEIKFESIESALSEAVKLDRFAGLLLKLIFHLEVSPRQALALRPRRGRAPDGRGVTFSHGGRSESSLFINLTDVGIELIKEAVALSSVQGDDRLLRPGRNVDKERQHLYYIARQVGLSSGGLGVTLTQLPAMHARFRREGTLPGLTE